MISERIAHERRGAELGLRQRGTWQQATASSRGQARSSSGLVEVALRYVGDRKFTGKPGAWCRDATNMWLRKAGYHTDGSRLALDAVHLGPRLRGPRPGALGVMRRRGGGHVGIVIAVHGDRVEMIAGNSRRGRVAVESFPRSRFSAFVAPLRG